MEERQEELEREERARLIRVASEEYQELRRRLIAERDREIEKDREIERERRRLSLIHI